MGIVLVPLLFVMLLGFSYLGIKSGSQAILNARGRLTATLFLLAVTALLATVEIVLPFLMERHRKTHKPILALSASAFFLAAAIFPVSWFWWAERMSTWFQVTWSY
jgi:hypothetical protein